MRALSTVMDSLPALFAFWSTFTHSFGMGKSLWFYTRWRSHTKWRDKTGAGNNCVYTTAPLAYVPWGTSQVIMTRGVLGLWNHDSTSAVVSCIFDDNIVKCDKRASICEAFMV